jgi:predicted naringenin-chalcone synthase
VRSATASTSESVRAAITGAASAYPPGRAQDELWDNFFAAHYSGNRWAQRVWRSAGIERRHCAFDPTKEDLSSWSTRRRMDHYAGAAVPLAAEAAAGALQESGIGAKDLGLLVVASCTGYVTPGVDILLADALGVPASAQRLLVGHMGCHAAIPGLSSTADYVAGHGRPALLVCVELPSLHVQSPTADLGQVAIHALFGDAAAAVVLEPVVEPDGGRSGSLAVSDVAARTDTATSGLMTWEITDRGFRMGLDRRVPDVIGSQVTSLVDELLSRNGLERTDVAGWAVHPGGPRILDVVAARLGLTDDQVGASRDVLAKRGNCSSTTVLLIVEELHRRRCRGPVVVLAFGPGLTLYACLLR